MTLVRPSSDALNQLVGVFQEKVELLQKLVVLHGSNDVDDVFLNQVETEVRALEHCVGQVRQNIAVDQDFVATARALILALKIQQSKSCMLEQHMPSHLQATSPPSHKRSACHSEEKMPQSGNKRISVRGLTIPLPSPAMFDAVPKYIKGRLSYEKLIEICEALSNALTQKYKILATKRSGMSEETLRKFKVFKDQECESTEGFKFLSTPEFKLLNIVLDAPTKGTLGVLKHTNALKVDTVAGVSRYRLIC